MSRFLFLYALLLVTIISCRSRQRYVFTGDGKHLLAIQPFIGADPQVIAELKSGLTRVLNAEVIVLPVCTLPRSAFNPARNRYYADSLLDFLKGRGQISYEKIIGITVTDISTSTEESADWGIMGLAKRPGTVCVLSTYRVKKTIRNKEHFFQRMLVLALHELGHTYSLPHCSKAVCLMKDAEGKMNLDDGKDFCGDCSAVLNAGKILIQY